MIVLIGSFLVLLLLKTPVSFSMFVSSILYLLTYDIPVLVAVQRMASGPDSFPLLAVPGFILAGTIMNTSGITERLFNFANKCVGHITGGLGHANIFASIIFAGMSGTAIADAAGMGAVELKAMKDRGFDEDFSLAVTGASSIVGPIIPPSVPAVLYGVVASVSIGRLFAAGFIPGVLMGCALSVLVFIQAKKRGYPKELRPTVKEFSLAFKDAFFPLLTPVLIIGGILIGVFTPTEAAFITVIYSIVLGISYQSIRVRDLLVFVRETANTTVSVMLIVASSAVFAWILASEQIPQKLAEVFLVAFPNKYVALVVINLFLLIAGSFMETIAAITILTPVLLPVVLELGVDPVHFGILMILNLMIGLLTPPIGMVLYVLSTVSQVPFEKIAKAVVPYLLLLIGVLYVLTFLPDVVLWLPNLIFNK
ncbi:TRAP transporter large permease [Marispirochaeta sp.]|uniref:TRAP transporter large permease n=1 Tax=Marispirochaeta sp. TaxID=2038653 RepID=UPI0029C62AFF|nr:TRAP transporter large permease [Marispirochaeta sp.]